MASNQKSSPRKLPPGAFIKKTGFDWGKMFLPALKAQGLIVLTIAAGVTLWAFWAHNSRVSAGSGLWPLVALMFAANFIAPTALLNLAFDIRQGQKPLLGAGLGRVLQNGHRIIIAAAAAWLLWAALAWVKPGEGASWFEGGIYALVAATWSVLVFLLFNFWVMAIMFNNDTILKSLKTAFKLVRKNWGTMFFMTIAAALGAVVAAALVFGALSAVVYMLFQSAADAVFADMRGMGFFALFYHGARMWLPVTLILLAFCFVKTITIGFLAAYMVNLYINARAGVLADGAQIPILWNTSSPDFSSFFAHADVEEVQTSAQSPDDASREYSAKNEEHFEDLQQLLAAGTQEDDIADVLAELSEEDLQELPSSVAEPTEAKK